MQIRCNFPDISYLSEMQKINLQFLTKMVCVCLFDQVTDVKFVPDSHLLVQTGEDKEVRYVLVEPSDEKIYFLVLDHWSRCPA